MRWRTVNRHRNTLDELGRLSAHELLGVSPTATETEIKAAYRRKVRAYHPDFIDPFLKRYGEEVMKLLNRAYGVLLLRRHS